MRVVRHWHRLPRQVMDAPCLVVVKVRSDGSLMNVLSRRCPCPWQGRWNRMIYEVPYNL